MIYLIFDTETTGLPKNYRAPSSDVENWPRLVQLSCILTDGKEREEFDFIIKPEGFMVPDEASAIHGITHDRAMAEGRDREFVLNIFRCLVNVADKIIAHNIDFDKAIMGAEYYRMFKTNVFEQRLATKELYCTMKSATDIAKIKGTHAGQNKWPRLIELYKFLFNEEFDGAHNSLMDSRACERCFFKLQEMKAEEIMEKTCNRVGCGKPHNNAIKTDVGYFCSEECRKTIENNVFNFLSKAPKLPI